MAGKQTRKPGKPEKKRSKGREVWGRLRKNKMAMISLAVLVIIIFSAVFADLIAPYRYDAVDIRNQFAPLSPAHWLGTDNFGRDILSRIIYGGRISLLAIAISTCVGGALGATAAYFGGRYESVVMRCLDVLMAIPALLLAISISAALGSGVVNSAIALAVAGIPSSARLMRATVLGIKDQDYVEAARATGVKNGRIILHHILPNTFAPILVDCTLRIGANILQISTLSFIGLGVQPPTPEWGYMISDARGYILTGEWWMIFFPGLAIASLVLSFNLFGDGLRDALDYRTQ